MTSAALLGPHLTCSPCQPPLQLQQTPFLTSRAAALALGLAAVGSPRRHFAPLCPVRGTELLSCEKWADCFLPVSSPTSPSVGGEQLYTTDIAPVVWKVLPPSSPLPALAHAHTDLEKNRLDVIPLVQACDASLEYLCNCDALVDARAHGRQHYSAFLTCARHPCPSRAHTERKREAVSAENQAHRAGKVPVRSQCSAAPCRTR